MSGMGGWGDAAPIGAPKGVAVPLGQSRGGSGEVDGSSSAAGSDARRSGDAGAGEVRGLGGSLSPRGDAGCRGKGEGCWLWVTLSLPGKAWAKVILKKTNGKEKFPLFLPRRRHVAVRSWSTGQDVLPAQRNPLPRATARLFLAGSGRAAWGEVSPASAPV